MEQEFNKKEINQQREKDLQELDRIAKMLIRRDLERSLLKEELETKLQELQQKTEELEHSERILKKISEDLEKARKEAIEEKNRTLKIIANLSDGLLVFDEENNLSLINPQAEFLLNVQKEAVLDKHILELSRFSRLEPLVKLLGGGIKSISREELLIKENIILEVTSIFLMEDEEKIGSLVTLHDITRDKLVEKLKTEFVSLAAHQLRTPISAIKWTLRMLLDGDLGEINKDQRNFIEKTYASNERMISLINDLLDITRIEEGRYLYKLTLANFEEIIQSVIDSYKEEIRKRGISFKFKKSWRKLPSIMVDVEKIKLAIQNLIDNAIKYTPVGGRVTILLNRDTKEIEVAIQDTGVGIPKAQQERVFTKFFRGTNVMRMETEGTGLGLFITKNIIEAHGGEIWFESEEGRGTTFYFTLPVKKGFAEYLTKEFY